MTYSETDIAEKIVNKIVFFNAIFDISVVTQPLQVYKVAMIIERTEHHVM